MFATLSAPDGPDAAEETILPAPVPIWARPDGVHQSADLVHGSGSSAHGAPPG